MFDGASMVVDADGELIARASQFDEQVLVVDIDVRPVFRKRLLDPRGSARHRAAHRHRRHRGPRRPRPRRRAGRDACARAGRRGVRRPRPRAARLRGEERVHRRGPRPVGRHRLLARGLHRRRRARARARAHGGHAVALLERGLQARRLGPGRQPRRRPPHHRHRGRLRVVPRAAGAVVRGREPRPHRGEPPEPHPRDAPDGAVEQVRVDGGHHRQQERDGGGLLHLYGDTAGGFAVIKDVPKLLVYRLCEHVNAAAAGR